MITWSTLTDGLLGAVLGGVVVFGATIFTLWRTRVGDRHRENIRLRERDVEQRQQYVADVIGTFRNLEREMRLPPIRRAHSQAAFLRASMAFYMTQKANHEQVATWLMKRSDDFGAMSEAWHKRWWVPFVGVSRLKRLTAYLGEVCGVLVLWATGDLRDENFDDADLAPSLVAKTAAATRPEIRD